MQSSVPFFLDRYGACSCGGMTFAEKSDVIKGRQNIGFRLFVRCARCGPDEIELPYPPLFLDPTPFQEIQEKYFKNAGLEPGKE